MVEPSRLAGPMKRFHAELHEPLVAALRAMGEPHPVLTADVIGGVLVKVAHGSGPSDDRLNREETLALLRRLLGGYLRLLPAA